MVRLMGWEIWYVCKFCYDLGDGMIVTVCCWSNCKGRCT